MKSFRLLLLALMLASASSVAQTADLFTWSQGNVLADSKYMLLGDNNDTPMTGDEKLNIYKTYNVYSPDGKSKYVVRLNGTRPAMTEDGMYDGFSITNSSGQELLLRFGNDPLWAVRNLTTAYGDKANFIQVPLANESFALIFSGCLFDACDEAGEMIIVVVNKDKATVVYDAPAFAYKYTAPPNFSIEFVDNIAGLLDDYGKSTVTAAKLASRTKYKIWREGDMLKYKSWK